MSSTTFVRPSRWLAPLAVAAVLVPALSLAAPAHAAEPPVAVDDVYTTTQSMPVTTQTSIFDNDRFNGGSYTYTILPPIQIGKLVPTPEIGKFVYTPDQGFSGTDVIRYCLSRDISGGGCASEPATITFNVAPAVPIDDHVATTVDTAVTFDESFIMANDQNANPTGLGWWPSDRPSHGTLSASAHAAVIYTPNPGFLGVDSFHYCLTQVSGPPCESSLATVVINVGLPGSTRITGADRYEVAVRIATGMYPSTAPVLFVASGANYPDALSAGPAAARLGGPLLLTLPDRVPGVVAAKVTSLHPDKIIVVGGVNSVSDVVFSELKTLAPGATVERIGGADRYEVSRNVADRAFGSVAHAFVTTGANFPDALSAGAAAGAAHEPVVLVRGDAQSADAPTLAFFAAHMTANLTIVGGVNSVSTAVEGSLGTIGAVVRVAGADRYEASSNLNHTVFTKAPAVYLATGLTYPDALTGSVLAGSTGSPLYVVPRTCVPRAVIDDIVRIGAMQVVLLGGPISLTDDVAKLVACP